MSKALCSSSAETIKKCTRQTSSSVAPTLHYSNDNFPSRSQQSFSYCGTNKEEEGVHDSDDMLFCRGTVIRTSVSMMSNSMMYSDDEFTATQPLINFGQGEDDDLSSVASISTRSTGCCKASTILSDVFLGNPSRNSFDSEDISFFQATNGTDDYYFSPIAESSIVTQENLNNPLGHHSYSFEDYIFTDDDQSSIGHTAPMHGKLTPVKEAKEDYVSTLKDDVTRLIISAPNHISKDDLSTSELWEQLNQQRDYQPTKQWLQLLNSPSKQSKPTNTIKSFSPLLSRAETASMSDDSEPHLSLSSDWSPCRNRFWGRYGFARKQHHKHQQQRFDRLDTNNSSCLNPHRVSDLAVSAFKESAVRKRNLSLEFAVWEAALATTVLQHSNVHKQTDMHSDIASEIKADKAREQQSYGIPMSSIFNSNHSESIENSICCIEARSLTTQDFVSTHRKTMLPPNVDIRHGLEGPRVSSEDVAAALGISGIGLELLQHIRCRSGIIEDLEPEALETDMLQDTIPWIHLQDDIWMPHYEEYVVRAVHSFRQCLMGVTEAEDPANKIQPVEVGYNKQPKYIIFS